MRRWIGGTTALAAAIWAIGVLSPAAGADPGTPGEWNALNGDGLVKLARQMAAGGEAAAEGRRRLAGLVLEKYLGTPEASRTMTCGQWRALAEALGKDVADEVRRKWRERLRGAFLDQKALAAMKPADAVDLTEALTSLGEKGADDTLVAWMTAGTGWQSAEPWALRMLTESLARRGDATKPLRDKLLDHIGRTYLAGPQGTWKGGCYEWKVILQSLAEGMDARTRQQWIAKLRAVFLDPKVLTSPEPGIVFLWEVLDGLGDRDACTVLAAWMQAGPTWQSAAGDDLARLAYGLERGGEAMRSQRARLLDHVVKVRLATPETTRKISGWAWHQLVLSLGRGVDDSARRTWQERLRTAYGDAETLAAMKPEQVVDLSEALDVLGDGKSYDVVLVAMAANPQWRSLDVYQTTRLCQRLARGGDATKAQRLDLAAVVAARFLATPEAARSVGRWDWKEWAGTLGKELDAGSRRLWVTRLREAFTKPEVFAAMPLGEVRDLSDALRALGDGEAKFLVAAWVSAGTAWQSLPPGELAGLAASLFECREGGKAARLRLMEHVTRAYLATSESTRKASCGQWSGFIQSLAGELEPRVRRTWAGALRAAFVDPKALVSLEKKDVLDLAWVLEALGETAEAAYGVAASWMAVTPAWQSLKLGDLRELADALDRVGEKTKAERLRLAEHLTGKYLVSADGARAATCGEWRGLAGSLGKDMGAETRRAWTTGLRNAFAGAEVLALLKPADVLDLVAALEALGDKEACGVVVVWMSGSPAWQSLDAGGLRGLAECLKRGGEAAKAMRLRLAEHVTKSRLGTTEAVRGVTCGEWRGLAGSLAKDLDPAAREVWAEKIRGAFADPRTMASMKPQEVVSLAATLESLGDKRVPDILTSWILKKR